MVPQPPRIAGEISETVTGGKKLFYLLDASVYYRSEDCAIDLEHEFIGDGYGKTNAWQWKARMTSKHPMIYGRGNTPGEAVIELKRKIESETNDHSW